MKQQVTSSEAPKPVARYSQGIKVGNTLFIQGIVALDPQTNRLVQGDVRIQAKRVFESMKAILKSAGMELKDVVKITAFLSNLDNYRDFNEIYNAYFSSDPAPVRTTVQAKMPLDALVEVEAIAYKE